MKNNCEFLVGHVSIGKFTFIKIAFQKKSKFSLLLKINLLFYYTSKQLFFFLAYFCSELIILMLFLLNISRPFFFIYLFRERFDFVQNPAYIKQYFCYDLRYHLFINPTLVFSLLGINSLELWQRFFTHPSINVYIQRTHFLCRQFFSLVIIIFYGLLAIKKT